MKKICYVVTLPVTIKAFFIPQLKFLSQNGYDVTVICSKEEGLDKILGEDIKYLPVDIPRGISFLGSLKAIKNLKKIFKREKFDIIQYSTPNASFYSSIAGKKAGIKIRNYHLMGLRYLGAHGIIRKILKWIEKKTVKNSTSIECVSQSNLELCVKEGLFSRDKATVVFNGSTGGVDLERFDYKKSSTWRSEKRQEYKLQEDNLVFGFVGRITRDKGVNELLEAFKAINQKNPLTRLVLIGNIDESSLLTEEFLKELENNENIIHIPQTPKVEEYFPMLDVLVLPSYREGFGNVVIEAEAMGVPVIVSDIPGPIDAMREGETGLKVEVKNVPALINAMEQAKSFKANGYPEKARLFAEQNFDSKILCEKILLRKNELLS